MSAPNSSDAIVIQNLCKQFKKATIRREYTTFKSELVRFLKREKRPESVNRLTALKDVTLTVRKGKTFGLIGRNGSGKSTLLKCVTGIYTPTSGAVHVSGRISALLELGAGFHPDFSGRENIMINGIILGMSRREIKAKMDEIIEFSEIGEFIDEPVRTYSSGMYARLAFSVATHVDPEVLIIDEILSVGDEHFAHKSAAKMAEFKKRGKTIMLVTHDLLTLQERCDEAAWLDGGVIRAFGNPAEVVAKYRLAVAEEEARPGAPPRVGSAIPVVDVPQPKHGGPAAEPGKRWGSFEIELTRIRLLNGGGLAPSAFSPEDTLQVVIDYAGADRVPDAAIEVSLAREDGLVIWSARTGGAEAPVTGAAGSVTLKIPRIGLGDGRYYLSASASGRGGVTFDLHNNLYSFEVTGPPSHGGLTRPVHEWIREELDHSRPAMALAQGR